jgi:uncharacterized phage protein (TIGR01671 family)
MREILFKAKRIDNNEWVQGNLFIEGNRAEIIRGTCNCVGIEGVSVDKETICQYTGLTDKNGKKIWENDICSTDIKRPYAVVEFRNGCFMYNLNDGEEDYYDIMMPVEPLVDSDKYTEVIGNIFDNLELLERN